MPAVGKGVRFQTPSLPDQDSIDRYFALSRKVGWYSNFGPCVRLFEQRMSAELLSGQHAVSASNATVALMVAMRAVFGEAQAGIGLVVVPSFTFIGSLSAITWAGFRPLFVDIDPHDWQVSEQSLATALGDHADIVGALLTSTFGTPVGEARREALESILAERRIPVVVDSAAGLGSCPPTALPGAASVYSLHATKPFAVGEGAVVACVDPDVAARIRRLTNFGFDDDHAVGEDLGLNAKLPEILAATGLAVLDHFPEVLARRREKALALIDRVSGLGFTAQRGFTESSFQFVPVLCPTAHDRQRLLAAAMVAQVQVRTYFDPPMHRVAAFKGSAATSLPVTQDVASRIVALPMANGLAESEVHAIVDLCRGVLG